MIQTPLTELRTDEMCIHECIFPACKYVWHTEYCLHLFMRFSLGDQSHPDQSCQSVIFMVWANKHLEGLRCILPSIKYPAEIIPDKVEYIASELAKIIIYPIGNSVMSIKSLWETFGALASPAGTKLEPSKLLNVKQNDEDDVQKN